MTVGSAGGDVAVVGAGLIGLAIAYELAERGAVVRVFDRAEPGRAASWAGAGMLAPYTERIDDEALLEICAKSLAEYPAFVDRVRRDGGVDPKLHLDGIVRAAFDSAHLGELRAHGERLRARGVACDVLDREQTLMMEPALGAHVAGGLLIRGEGHVDNRRLGRALVAACEARGVAIANASSLAVECDARRALGVRTDRGFAPSTAVVNACGAWSAQLQGVPAACVPPVEPVKGEMLALEAPVGFFRHATWVTGAYFVPRDDGRLLIGGTSERTGFDARVTAQGIHRLLHAALVGAPSLADFTVSETWAGLRPGTPDGRPFVGPTELEGLWVATGHYRNGILLAPVTARLIADALENGETGELAPFSLARAGRSFERSLS
jgi:glycine oxidase